MSFWDTTNASRSYGTDNFFMREYNKNHGQFVILDCAIEHDLACFTPERLVETKLRRHHENMNSVRLLNEQGSLRAWIAQFYCGVHSLRQAIRYRDLRFLA